MTVVNALTNAIDATEEGGTVKLFHQGAAPPQAGILAGRVYLRSF